MTLNKYCLKWENFRLNTASSFKELRGDTDFSDVTLACEDRSLTAHRVVLAAGSLYFRRVLRKLVHPHPLVYMRGVRAASLEALLDFLYLGEASLGEEVELNTFLALARELEVKGLDEDEGKENETFTKEIANIEGTNDEGHMKEKLFNHAEEEKPLNEESTKTQSISNVKKLSLQEWKAQTKVSTKECFDVAKPYLVEENKDIVVPTVEENKVIEAPTVVTNTTVRVEYSESGLLAATQSLMDKVGKIWTCRVCGKTSSHTSHMRGHVEIHIDGLQIKCKICGKPCKCSASLRTHISWSHKEYKALRDGEFPILPTKSHSCTLCVYTCTRASNLTRHMMTHT